MTKRENILLQILLLLCCSCFFYFTFSSSFSVISQSKKGITEYETMLNKIKSTVTDTITEDQYKKLRNSCGTIRHMLISSINTVEANNKSNN